MKIEKRDRLFVREELEKEREGDKERKRGRIINKGIKGLIDR